MESQEQAPSTVEPGPVRDVGAGYEAAALGDSGACPFLVAAGGAWRMSAPDRDHRCAAFAPATSLAPTKQARLCLTPAHAGCATYIASTSAREARVGTAAPMDRAGRWGIARTMPVVREVGGLRATLGALVADRRTWPAIPAVLLASLALALGLSGAWGEAPVTAVASPTPTPPVRTTPVPSRAPSPITTEPAATAAPSPTPGPTVAPSPTLAFTTYRVQSGDTLSGIASRFHTTVRAITRLNGISASTVLHAGDILKIPTS